MDQNFNSRRQSIINSRLNRDVSKDLYADLSVLQIINNSNTDAAMAKLLFTANWFEHPHPNGRDLRGEADFAAIRMVNALYQCFDRLTDEIKAALENFYLCRDYSSIYGSENHSLMYHVARLLAAQFYKDKRFVQYGKNSEEIIKEDEQYVDDFIMYRAGRSWGEFDSCGYGAEIMLILNTLYLYTNNSRLKKKAAMMMDMILLDMIVDTKNGLYGGAHGRIYEGHALNSASGGMYSLYTFYFGAEAGLPESPVGSTIALLSDYYPADIVYKVAKNRKYPYENRERKHLHCCEAWIDYVHNDILKEVEGLSIDKYIYICDDYMLGSVVHQDKYPDTVPSGWYAHHQQHEWELTFPDSGNGSTKIFSHHPGNPLYHKQHQHNQWTGDIHCNCGTHFCTKDTAISMYNIVKEREFKYINAYIPLDSFDEKKLEKNYIFLRHNKMYIMVWFSGDYRFVTEGPSAGYEAISDGSKHAFICHVEPAEKFASIDDFAEKMKEIPIVFDSEKMDVDFNGIHVDYDGNSVNGVRNVYPYEKLFDSPYLTSEYGSGILNVTDGKDSAVYDFNF